LVLDICPEANSIMNINMVFLQRTSKVAKTSLGVTVILAGFILLVQPVSTPLAFASAPERTAEETDNASAEWNQLLSPTDRTITRLSVSESDGITHIILSINILDLDAGEATRLIGQLDTTDDIFNMDKNLGSASLSAVDVDICLEENQDVNGVCTIVQDTVTVQADWIASGHADRERTQTTSDGTKVVVRTATRDATADATIDGESLTDLVQATLSKTTTLTTTTIA